MDYEKLKLVFWIICCLPIAFMGVYLSIKICKLLKGVKKYDDAEKRQIARAIAQKKRGLSQEDRDK